MSFSKVAFWLFAEFVAATLLKIISNQESHSRKLEEIMALVSIEQDELDGIASDVSDAADLLQGILDSETPTPAADETAIKAAVEKLKGVGPKVAPVEPSE